MFSCKIISEKSEFLVIIQFRYLYLLSIKQNNVTSLRRRYLTLLWSCHIVAVETLDDIAKKTSLQRLIMTSLYERLQRRRFFNIVRRFHCNYMAASERCWIATSQQHFNDVFVSTGKEWSRYKSSIKICQLNFLIFKQQLINVK